jgi:hypothetical protein
MDFEARPTAPIVFDAYTRLVLVATIVTQRQGPGSETRLSGLYDKMTGYTNRLQYATFLHVGNALPARGSHGEETRALTLT